MCTIWEYVGTGSEVPTVGPNGETLTSGRCGSRLATAPTMVTLGPAVPGIRKSETRSCQEVNPAPFLATQVSTLTEARSSDWGVRVRRLMVASDVQRPSTSQLVFSASGVRPLTSISIQLPFGVVACHEAISWVRPKVESTHGALHRPRSNGAAAVLALARRRADADVVAVDDGGAAVLALPEVGALPPGEGDVADVGPLRRGHEPSLPGGGRRCDSEGGGDQSRSGRGAAPNDHDCPTIDLAGDTPALRHRDPRSP